MTLFYRILLPAKGADDLALPLPSSLKLPKFLFLLQPLRQDPAVFDLWVAGQSLAHCVLFTLQELKRGGINQLTNIAQAP